MNGRIVVNTKSEVLEAMMALSPFVLGSELQQLDISDEQLEPEAIKYLSEALKHNTTLINLDVTANEIGTEGAKYLSKALIHNSTLTQLYIAIVQLEAKGAKYLCEALKHNSTLQTLDLQSNELGIEGAKYLREALKLNSSLTELNACENEFGAEGMKYLSDALKHNSSLTILNIGRNKIGAGGAKYLSDMLQHNSTLTCLNVHGNNLEAEGVKCLSEVLAHNSTLINLSLWENKMETEGAKHLGEALKQNTTLAIIDMGFNSLREEGIQFLSNALTVNSTLTHLNIGFNPMGAKGAMHLSEALSHNSSISTLKLFGSPLGAEGIKFLSEALKHNCTLTHINLTDTKLDNVGIRYLSEALKFNSSITRLDLNGNGNEIGPEGMKYLGESLKHNFTVSLLSLPSTIKSEETLAISDCLSRNTHLKRHFNELVSFLLDETLTDVKLQAREGTLRAHKVVLAARSRVFRDILQNRTEFCDCEHQCVPIIILDIPVRLLAILLDYLYTDELEATDFHNSNERREFMNFVAKYMPEQLVRIQRLLASQLPTEVPSTLGKEMLWAVNNTLFHDVIFAVGDDDNVRQFAAHKVVLCSRSTYFKALLLGGITTTNYSTPNGGGLSVDLMIDTFSVACQYNLEPLRCKLEAMLALKIAEESVHSLLMLADAHHAMKLRQECYKYLTENNEPSEDCLKQNSAFTELTAEDVSTNSINNNNPNIDQYTHSYKLCILL